MTAVAIFFQEAGALDYPLNNPKYMRHFAQLVAEIEALGAAAPIVRHQSTYLGSGQFSKSWLLRDGQVIESGEVQADIVFDKGMFTGDGNVPVLNCPEITDICTDKYKTFKLFRDYSPQSYWVDSEAELHEALAILPGPYGVVKPVDGLEARNVHIGPTEELEQQEHVYPLLVQAFLDSQDGIPGIVNGVHDFRVALLNGEIVHAFVRTPPPGQYIASVSRGAQLTVVEDLNLIPPVILEMVAAIDAHMAAYGDRFYGIDLALVHGRPQIIELNSRVSIWDNAQHPVFASTKEKLAQVLVSLGQASLGTKIA